MKDKEGTGWFIPVIVLLLLGYPVSPLVHPSGPASSSAVGKSPAQDKPVPVAHLSPESLGQLLDEFLGIDSNRKCTSWPEGDPRKDLKIQFLVATLPDPADTRFGYMFDRNLGAIQRAVESKKYVLDRFYLPWLEPEPDRSTLRTFARLPGILLFHSRHLSRLLAVFVVGESPTSGIHQEAFQLALTEIAGMSGWISGQRSIGNDCWPKTISSQPDIKRIRILGPSFSGSATSLEFAIRSWLSNKLTNPIDFQIVSGSATAIPKSTNDGYRIGLHSFRSTLISDAISQKLFLQEYLQQERKVALEKVALLVEANTFYGQASTSAYRQGSPGGIDVVKIPFPLHIARLRSEVARSRQELATQSDLARPPRITHLPQLAEENAREIIPPMSELETSALEPLIADIFRAIDLERFRYVGIIASDVQDVIFLASEVRRHCPNTVVFTFNSDMLYLHPDVNPDLYGMLVVTTYPLVSINRTRTYPFSASTGRLAFTSDIEQGVYNATLAQLEAEDGMLEYAPPLRHEVGKERKPPLWVIAVGHDSFYPIRLFPDPEGSEDYMFQAKYSEAAPQNVDMESGLTSGLGRMTFVVWCIGSLVVIFLLLRPFRGATGGTKDVGANEQGTARCETGGGGQGRHTQVGDRLAARLLAKMKWKPLTLGEGADQNPLRQLYMFGSFVSLLLFHMLLSAIWLMCQLGSSSLSGTGNTGIRHQGSWKELPTAFSLFAVLAVYLVIIVILAVNIFRSKQRLIGREGCLSIVFVLLSCLAGLASAGALSLSWIQTSSDPALAYYLYSRATAVNSGLSPLFPLLFVALASFSCTFSVLRRFRLLEEEKKDLGLGCVTGNVDAFPNWPPPSFRGIEKIKSRLRSHLSLEPSALPGAGVAVIILILPCIRIFSDSFSLSLEGKPFVYFFLLAFGVVYLGLTMEFFRFVLVYRDLRKLLQHISRHPMERAYRGLSEAQEVIPKLTLTSLSSPYAAVEFALKHAALFVSRLRMLADREIKEAFEGGLEEPALSNGVADAQQAFADALASDASGDFEGGLCYRRKTREALLRIAQRLACCLESRWFVRATSTGNQEPGNQNAHGSKVVRKGEKRLRAHTERSLAQLGENFLAAHSVSFVHLVIAHLKNLAGCITGGLLLMLMAITVYAFQPREVLLVFNWMVVLSAGTVIIAASVQLDRDPVLSELSGTTPGRVTWDREFLWRIIIYGILPILGLLGAQFPGSISRLVLLLVGPHPGGTA